MERVKRAERTEKIRKGMRGCDDFMGNRIRCFNHESLRQTLRENDLNRQVQIVRQKTLLYQKRYNYYNIYKISS
jgi:hypothetical protein